MVCAVPAGAAMTRSETYVVISDSSLAYHAEIAMNGTEARTERARADADGDGAVNISESDAYAAALVASRTGNASSWFYWDGNEVTWTNLSVALGSYVAPTSSRN